MGWSWLLPPRGHRTIRVVRRSHRYGGLATGASALEREVRGLRRVLVEPRLRTTLQVPVEEGDRGAAEDVERAPPVDGATQAPLGDQRREQAAIREVDVAHALHEDDVAVAGQRLIGRSHAALHVADIVLAPALPSH